MMLYIVFIVYYISNIVALSAKRPTAAASEVGPLPALRGGLGQHGLTV